jgi:hypothetical protein
MKGQDLVVLAKLFDSRARSLGFLELGRALALSASETHAAVRRLRDCGLVDAARAPIRRNVMEFLFSGLRYVFPFRPSGGSVRGLPTAWGAPVAQGVFAVDGPVPVWAVPDGDAVGPAYAPLYPTAPRAARADRALYDRLALFDLARGGRLRERAWARERLEAAL